MIRVAAAAVGAGAAAAGAVTAIGSILSSLADFVKTVISNVIDAVRRIAQWYANLLAKDPGAAIALALVGIYWVMPE